MPAAPRDLSASGTLYSVLGVTSDASPAEIGKAYRRLAHRLHPDRSPLPSSIDAFEPRLGYIVGGLEIHSGFLSLERAQMWCADDAPRCAGFTTMAPMPGAPRATELFVRFSSSSEVVHHGGWYAWVRADRGDSAKEEL